MSINAHLQPAAVCASRTGPTRVLLALSAVAGAGTVLVSGWFLTHQGNPIAADPELFLLGSLVGSRAAAATLGILGLLGVLTTVAALAARPSREGLVAVATIELLGFGVALQGTTTIALAGYLLALALPVGLMMIVGLTVHRYPRWRWVVIAAVAAALGGGVLSGILSPAPLGRLVSNLVAGFAAAGPKLGVAVLLAASVVLWVLIAARLVRGWAGVDAVGGWVLRHRRGLTVAAAAGPLPYALVRATWLTPWPLVGPVDESLPPEVRLWGLLLGGGALLGAVLTVGLIRPWGEVFPRWMPRLAGRRVPAAAAVVPGGVVAGIVCAAAVPMLTMIVAAQPDTVAEGLSVLQRIEMAVVFPFWFWGPTLALAVWGYARHRETTRRSEAELAPSARE